MGLLPLRLHTAARGRFDSRNLTVSFLSSNSFSDPSYVQNARQTTKPDIHNPLCSGPQSFPTSPSVSLPYSSPQLLQPSCSIAPKRGKQVASKVPYTFASFISGNILSLFHQTNSSPSFPGPLTHPIVPASPAQT